MTSYVPATSIAQALSMQAAAIPGQVAVIDNNEEQINYADLWKEVQGFATYIKSLGIGKGDKVVVKSSHTISYVVSFLGIQLAGAVHVPTEKSIGDEGLDSVAELMHASLVIADDYTSELPVIAVSEVRSFAQANVPAEEITEFPESEDLADILFTTGTTGASKGVMISHRAIIAVCENVIYGAQIPEGNVYMVPNPINHAAGIRKIYVTILTGTTVVLIDGFMNLKKFFRYANDYHVTSILMPPSAIRIMMMMAKKNMAALADQLDHIHSGSAPLSDADKQRLRETLPNTRLYFGYGSSEAGCSALYDYNEYSDLMNCSGRANVNAEIFTVDDDWNPVEASKDNPGTIAVRGPMNMTGYYNEPELTASVMKDGVVYTTDLGYIEDGFLYILGRKDDVINIGGLKIAPTEVESVALKFPGVSECICYSKTDAKDNMSIVMDVVLEKNADFDQKEFRKFMENSLESFKIPKTVAVVDEIAKTYNGKIDRKVYRK